MERSLVKKKADPKRDPEKCHITGPEEHMYRLGLLG